MWAWQWVYVRTCGTVFMQRDRDVCSGMGLSAVTSSGMGIEMSAVIRPLYPHVRAGSSRHFYPHARAAVTSSGMGYCCCQLWHGGIAVASSGMGV